MSDKKEEIVIDLSGIHEGLNLIQKSAEIRRLMNMIMTGTAFPSAKIIATPHQFDRFANTIGAERDYIVAYNKYGLNNPATYRNKYRLDSAVRKFERDTGLAWPFK